MELTPAGESALPSDHEPLYDATFDAALAVADLRDILDYVSDQLFQTRHDLQECCRCGGGRDARAGET